MADQPSYYEVLTAAIRDLAENGFDSAERVAEWERKIREAAERTMGSSEKLSAQLQEELYSVYRKLVDGNEALIHHPGVARFTIDRLKPALRLELDRRILASANLIRLNRRQAIDKTIQRFSGWASSVPAGGSKTVDKMEEKDKLRETLAKLPFEERRVLIDQGQKLVASIHETIATAGGALACRWHSRWRQKGYNYREDHKERDPGAANQGNVYLLRSSWARAAGLVKPGPAGIFEDVTRPGEEPFCRCFVTWIYGVRGLPDDMITAKGRAELDRVKKLREGVV